MAKPVQLFLSHTGANKTLVHRFNATLRHYKDIVTWFDSSSLLHGDDLQNEIARGISESSCVIVFWSSHALQKFESNKGIGRLSWISFEIRTAIIISEKLDKRIIFIRLDDTELPVQLAGHFATSLWIDAIGLLDDSRKDHDLIVWRASSEIVGTVRRTRPIFVEPQLFLDKNRKPVRKKTSNGYYYYSDYTWIGGHDSNTNNKGINYIDGYDLFEKQTKIVRATLVPAVKYEDGSIGYRFSLPNHTSTGWWSAAISFALQGFGWRTVDLTSYKEIRFDARADSAGTPLAVSFTDNDLGSHTPSTHQETSSRIFEIGTFWRSGAPWILNLDELDWSIKGFDMGAKGYRNTKDVDRQNVLQIVFNNGGKQWNPGFRWIEVKNIVIV